MVRRGNPKWPEDAAEGSGKSFLFCLSVRVPWNPIEGRYGSEREEHRICGGVRILSADLENSGPGRVGFGREADAAGAGPGRCSRFARVLNPDPRSGLPRIFLAVRPRRRLARRSRRGGVSARFYTTAVQRSAQNWHGQGESDCLIKTKHCDGPRGC
ncbi:unnamed protein product [Leptosia nina]|uniref:Uncharacterized protein n=1 Tax=Leptosia nina TaxID=320188 RepID=A0AAV1JZS7_9NEOP